MTTTINLISVPRARRYGRALRRLLSGKTSTVVWHIAKRMEADGLVVIQDTAGGPRASCACTLTDKGRAAAEAAKEGKNPYARPDAPKPRARHFGPVKRM